jgi:hypothetical protein
LQTTPISRLRKAIQYYRFSKPTILFARTSRLLFWIVYCLPSLTQHSAYGRYAWFKTHTFCSYKKLAISLPAGRQGRRKLSATTELDTKHKASFNHWTANFL